MYDVVSSKLGMTDNQWDVIVGLKRTRNKQYHADNKPAELCQRLKTLLALPGIGDALSQDIVDGTSLTLTAASKVVQS